MYAMNYAYFSPWTQFKPQIRNLKIILKRERERLVFGILKREQIREMYLS